MHSQNSTNLAPQDMEHVATEIGGWDTEECDEANQFSLSEGPGPLSRKMDGMARSGHLSTEWLVSHTQAQQPHLAASDEQQKFLPPLCLGDHFRDTLRRCSRVSRTI